MTDNKLIHKNDEITKSFLTNINVAKEFLTKYLHPTILARCDLCTLSIEPESYIDEELKKRFCDVVYKVALDNDSNSIYVHVLVEQQTKAEKLMPLRILRYTIDIIQKHVNKYGEDVKLPLVIPMVMYNGTQSPYPHTADVRELFVDKDLFDIIGLGKFKLVDLTITSDDELLKHKQLGLVEILLRHAYTRDFINDINVILSAFIEAAQDGLPKYLFKSALSYLYNAREQEELQPLAEKLIINLSNYEGVIMTYAETLRQEGRQEGKQEGKREGRHEGEQKASIEIARNLLRAGVDERTVQETTHLSEEQLKNLVF